MLLTLGNRQSFTRLDEMIASALWWVAVTGLAMGAALGACGGSVSRQASGDAGSSSASDPSAAGGEAGGMTASGPTPMTMAAGAPGALFEEVPITMSGGWAANTELGIQGTVSYDSDKYTAASLTSNLAAPVTASVSDACIKGTAAKVDQLSDACVTQNFTPPAKDCFAEFWGASIEINLNQPIDPDIGRGEGSAPVPFDASSLQGFSFDLGGNVVPLALLFNVFADGDELFCTPISMLPTRGRNQVFFSHLLEHCFKLTTMPPNATAETVQSKLLNISWQVRSKSNGPVPFDFCVSNLRAILK